MTHIYGENCTTGYCAACGGHHCMSHLVPGKLMVLADCPARAAAGANLSSVEAPRVHLLYAGETCACPLLHANANGMFAGGPAAPTPLLPAAVRDPNEGRATADDGERDGAAPVRAFMKSEDLSEVERTLADIDLAPVATVSMLLARESEVREALRRMEQSYETTSELFRAAVEDYTNAAEALRACWWFGRWDVEMRRSVGNERRFFRAVAKFDAADVRWARARAVLLGSAGGEKKP